MKIVIPGGTGQLGNILTRAIVAEGHEVVVLSRRAREADGFRVLAWDGKTLGAWAAELDGADVVINLAGRSVNCRYTKQNLADMMTSRVDSTRVVGEAIAAAERAPALWLQMSTATIYAHRFDAANDEETGIIGGNEADVPAYWGYSVDIATSWEAALDAADTPHTRKVALRTAMVMSADEGGVFDVLRKLTRLGLGGAAGDGKQFVSWIHAADFVRAVRFLIDNEHIHGAVNLAAPEPLPHKDFMAALRSAVGRRLGLPATRWMLEIGAFFMRSDTELLLKSRRVVPRRLLDEGFSFEHDTWPAAAVALAAA